MPADGILGQQVKLTVIDDACDGGQAIAAAQKLVAEKTTFVVRHLCSGASIPAAKVYEEAGNHPDHAGLDQSAADRGGPRQCLPHLRPRRPAGRHRRRLSSPQRWRDAKIAIVHDGSVYGKGLAEETRHQLHKRGLTEALYDALVPGQSDYSSLVAKLRAAGVDGRTFRRLSPGGRRCSSAMREVKAIDLQLVSGDGTRDRSSFCAGHRRRPAKAPGSHSFTRSAPQPSRWRAVVERFRQQGYEPEGYTLYSYGAVQAVGSGCVKPALGRQRPRPSSTASAQQLSSIRCSAPISFDAKGDVRQPGFAWYVWQEWQVRCPRSDRGAGRRPCPLPLSVRWRLLLAFLGHQRLRGARRRRRAPTPSGADGRCASSGSRSSASPRRLLRSDLSRQAERIVAAAPALLSARSQGSSTEEISAAITTEVDRLEALLGPVIRRRWSRPRRLGAPMEPAGRRGFAAISRLARPPRRAPARRLRAHEDALLRRLSNTTVISATAGDAGGRRAGLPRSAASRREPRDPMSSSAHRRTTDGGSLPRRLPPTC